MPKLGVDLLGRLTRTLPCRRLQTAHWLGKLVAPKEPFVGRFRGGWIEVHPGEIASTSSFYMGFYERELTIWCLDLIDRDPPELLVDVGANFGYYPLLFGLCTGGKTRAIAFEPDPSTFPWLRRNVDLNPRINVTPVAMAVGDASEGTIMFSTSKQNHNLWSRPAQVSGDTSHHSERVEIPVTRLDTYLDDRKIGRVPLTIIDVEGFEGHVLAGMRNGLLEKRYQRIVVEIHPWAFASPQAIEAMCQSVCDCGYRGFRFNHFDPPAPDKSPRYYRLTDDQKLLGPISYDNLTSWEHFLFEALA
jgi:FkbM family methyltransferase